MLFTIAIPTYNNEKTIAKAIRSALNQNYDSQYEILIVNNASKDNTQNVIDSFKDDKIRVVVNKETCDMYSNHNVCLKEAMGDYVLFCHSDDELLPNALTILSDRIKERNFPKRYILWGHSIFRDFYWSIQRGGQDVNRMFSGEASIRCFLGGGLTPSGTCYSRQSMLNIGGFPLSTVRSPEMDWAILIIAAYNCFEFEMIDRLYFKREFASTATNISDDEWTAIHKDTYIILFEKISEPQKEYFIQQMLLFGPSKMLDSIKDYIPSKIYKKRKLTDKIRMKIFGKMYK